MTARGTDTYSFIIIDDGFLILSVNSRVKVTNAI